MTDGTKCEQEAVCRYRKEQEHVRDQARRLHRRRYDQHLKGDESQPLKRKSEQQPSSGQAKRSRDLSYGKEQQLSNSSKDDNFIAPPSATDHASDPFASQALTFYPAYAHSASPTYFTWVKLTVSDIHHCLQHRNGYMHSWAAECTNVRDTPQILFYNNHPIQFVQVIGVVVSLDEYFEKFWLFTIDDSSGATIDVVCPKPTVDKQTGSIDGRSEEEKEQERHVEQLSAQVKTVVTIGAVLQVKATVVLFQRHKHVIQTNNHGLIRPHLARHPDTTFKAEEPVRQLALQRLVKVKNTTQEINVVAARNNFYCSVLRQPWVLSDRKLQKLHQAALGEVVRKQKKVRRKAHQKQDQEEQEKQDGDKIRRVYELEEQQRAFEADKARIAGQKLHAQLHMRQDLNISNHLSPTSMPPKLNLPNGNSKRTMLSCELQEIPCQSQSPPNSHYHSTRSFAADEEEKLALLHAAFGCK